MKIIIFSIVVAPVLLLALLFYGLLPASGDSSVYPVSVEQGAGFREIASILQEQGLIRSPIAFKIYSIISGSAHRLKPGAYLLSPSWSVRKIVGDLVIGPDEDTKVVIIEGDSVLDINTKLKSLGVLEGSAEIAQKLEGYLFPDTYRFFLNSPVEEITKKLLENFDKKALPALKMGDKDVNRTLIIASLIEKEVPFPDDRFLVSDILWRRLEVGMPLQVDASICYAKLRSSNGCHPLRKPDFEIDSRYNTYKYFGLPPTPIGNPGLSSIRAATSPRHNDYWYYLSDPETKKTIFAKTLEEHNRNQAQYFK